MVTININNKAYKLPERLTVEQYHKMLQFDWEDATFYPKIVGTLVGCNPLTLVNAPQDSMVLAISFIVKSMNERKECKTIDMENIKFGEFVDLDVYLSLGLEKHFKDIIALIAPEAKWADEAMWAVERFAHFRTYTYRQYKILFGVTDKELDEAEQKADIDKMQVARSWYKVIVSLAGDNVLNIDEVTEQPLKKVLNFMALQKEKVLEENQRQLQQKRQYDLQRTR